MLRRAAPLILALLLVCAVATVTSIVLGGVAHPIAESICRLAELVALVAAAGLAVGAGQAHEFGPRNAWYRVAAGLLLTNGSLAAAEIGAMPAEPAVVLAAGGAVVMLAALFAFEGGSTRPRAWLAVGLEIASTAAVVLAAGWVVIELAAPDLVFVARVDQVVALLGGVLFVLVGCLAAAFVLSSAGRTRVLFLLLGGWMATAAITVTWTAVTSILTLEPVPAVRFVSAAALCLPAAAAEFSRNRPAPKVYVGGRLARAHRGVLATLTTMAIVAFLGAWSLELLTETAAWIAVLGLPFAMARILITAGENRESARRLRDELERARVRNAELHAARTEAEAARDAQRAFLGRTSHELRTPLHAIIGFAELLESEDLSGDGHLRLGQIRSAGSHLLDLVEDLLDLQQIEAGQIALQRKAVGLRALVVDAAGQVGELAEAVDGRIAVIRGDWEDSVVHTDARRVRQILTQLLTNALRHAGGQVTVSVEASSWLVKLHVADTGPGLDADTLDRVFDPFERNGAEYGKAPGVGLGLSVARTLAEALGGRLLAESIPGVGSRFTLVLPTAAWPEGEIGDDPVEPLRPTVAA